MITPKYFEDYMDFIPDYESFLRSVTEYPPIFLRGNLICYETDFLEKKLDEWVSLDLIKSWKGISEIEGYYQIEQGKKPFGSLKEHWFGLFYIQGLSSLLPVIELNPNKEDRVLDMAAAPGGKSCYLAEKMENKGVLFVNEPNSNRRIALKANLDRMSVTNTVVTTYQGQDFPSGLKFSKILLDGPCSSEGTVRGINFSDRELEKREGFRLSLHKTQKQLILRAFDLLEDGGEMVYSTCTYDPRENECVIQYLLDEREEASIIPITSNFDVRSGLVEYKDKKFSKEMVGTFRVYPHLINSWGFFCAKLTKRRG